MHAKRILIVDDEPAVGTLTKVCLQREDYRIEVVSSALEALTRYLPGRYDVILTDHRMPDMTGLELASEIKRLQPDQPMILVSGSPPFPPTHVFDRVLRKPFSPSALREAVDNVTERSSPIGESPGL